MSEMHTPWRVEADERNYEVRGNLTSDTYIAGYNIYTADGDEVVGCEGIIDLASDRADFIVHCVNSHASLVEENKRMREALISAKEELYFIAHSGGDPDDASNMDSVACAYRDCRNALGDTNA